MSEPVAVVTGGAKGIGFALVEELLDRGFRVAMSDVNEAALQVAAESLRADNRGGGVLAVAADVRAADSMAQFSSRVRKDLGTPDLVINNAGVIGPIGAAWEGALEDWELAFDVNVWGVLHSMRSFLPAMIERNSGRLVNIASVASWSSAPMMSAYGATKHAVLALSESAYRELQALNSSVGITVVCPTTVRTSLIEDIAEGRQVADATAREKLLAARDAGARPEDVATLIIDRALAGDYLVVTDREWVRHAATQRVAIANGGTPPLDREPMRNGSS